MGNIHKYRKKPVVIEAIQLTKDTFKEVCEWVGDDLVTIFLKGDNFEGIRISTFEGHMDASMGDYIIKGIKGEFYPCKADIFEETYESA